MPAFGVRALPFAGMKVGAVDAALGDEIVERHQDAVGRILADPGKVDGDDVELGDELFGVRERPDADLVERHAMEAHVAAEEVRDLVLQPLADGEGRVVVEKDVQRLADAETLLDDGRSRG